MDENHLLKLGNPHRTIHCLATVLPPASIELLKTHLNANVAQLISLARDHLRFARTATGARAWRQQVSRGYYACYTASKALRLAIHGTYNTDTADHKQIASLPHDFPDHDRWADCLTKFRGDRNLADYDHTRCYPSLEHTPRKYLDLAEAFLRAATQYLHERSIL